MKTIELTKGQQAIVDDKDFPAVSQYRWQAQKNKKTYYATAYIGGKCVLMHRFILSPLPGFQIDHIDGLGTNNRRSNLRIVTSQMNNWNRHTSLKPRSTSKYKGVCWNQGRWKVQITIKGKRFFLGRFDDEIQAAKVYDSAALKHYGVYAHINFPKEAA